VDSDNDGLSDSVESQGFNWNGVHHASQPNDPDTDDDGYSDYFEEMRSSIMDPTQFTTIPALSVPYFVESTGSGR
jgi:hypothetical protein